MRRLALIAAMAATVAAAVDLPLPLRVGRAYRFSGAQRINAGTSSSLEVGTNDFTIALWVRESNSDASDRALATGATGNTESGYCVFFDAGLDALAFAFSDGFGREIQKANANGTVAIDNGGWVHAVGILHHATGLVDVYINAIKEETIAQESLGSYSAANMSNTLPLLIGDASTLPDLEFDGDISDVLMFNRALSADQVRGLYEDMGGVTNWPAGTAVGYPLQSAANTNIVYWLGDTKTVYTEGQRIDYEAPAQDSVVHWWRPAVELDALDHEGSLDGTTSGGMAETADAGWPMGTDDAKYVTLSGPINNGTNYSVSAWVKPDKAAMAPDAGGWVVSDRSAASGKDDFQLYYSKTTGSWMGSVFNSAGTLQDCSGPAIIDGEWQFICLVVNSSDSSIRVYRGTEYTEDTLTVTPNNGSDVGAAIGTASWAAGTPFTKYHGDIRNVQFYNRALTEHEVKEIAVAYQINDHSQSKITATAENGVIQTSRATEN